MDKENLVTFERKINQLSGTTGITIPKQLIEYINAKEGDIVLLAGDSGKYGRFIAFWKK